MGRIAYLAISFVFATASAALLAYSLAYTAHYYLGVSASALREQALVSAALIFGLVTIQLLVSEE